MYLLPSNSTFITRSRGEFSWPRDTGGSGLWILCFSFKFLCISFTAKCLKNHPDVLLPNTFSGGWAGLGQAIPQALLECPPLPWGHASIPDICVFPRISCKLIVRKGKTICILLSVKIMELTVNYVGVQCLLFIFSLSLWWSNTSRLQINLSAKLWTVFC